MSSAPRTLIVLRAGRNSIHQSWIWTLHGLLDVAISTYDDSDYSADGVARFFHQYSGGKFPGVKDFFDTHPSIIEEYDYFWLFEDDMTLPFGSLRMILKLLARFPFTLSAPALTHESIVGWPINMTNSRFLFRGTDFVEIMMPIMSRDFLRAALPAFDDSYSGQGQEWLWQKLLMERQTFAVIFDSAPMTHTRPYQFGSLNRNKSSGSPDFLLEKRNFFAKHKVSSWHPKNYFGVTSGPSPRILIQDAFVQEALGGYEALQPLRPDIYNLAINNLTDPGRARPTITYDELQKMPDFRMIENYLQTLAW
jgi:hypothetical protein